jgi:hypothetical protein
VKGPADFKVDTKSAFVKAATRIENCGSETATSTIVFGVSTGATTSSSLLQATKVDTIKRESTNRLILLYKDFIVVRI